MSQLHRSGEVPSSTPLVFRVPEAQIPGVTIAIHLHVHLGPDVMRSMQPLATAARGTDAPEHTTDAPVIGSIVSQPSELEGDIAAFGEYMLRMRQKKQKSVDNYVGMLRQACRITGWRRRSEITFESFTQYASAQPWARATRASHVSCWRSFATWLKASGRSPTDALEGVQRPMGIKHKGARAATTEEARRLIAYCVKREADGRSVGARALQRLCLFLGAMRRDEPKKLRVRNVVLDAPVPYFWWEPDINKANREEWLAMAPELAFHLRRYRDAVNEQRAAEGHPPLQPDERFFEISASTRTWRDDLRGAGITPTDFRGKRLSTNGARKWFQTVLEPGDDDGAGKRTAMIDLMMRHDKDVRSHYFDPSLERQFEFLHKLPRLWPNSGNDGDLGNGFGCGEPPPNPNSENDALDKSAQMRHTSCVASVPLTSSSPDPPAEHGRARTSGKAGGKRRASAIPRDDSAEDGAAFGFGNLLRPLSGSKYEADDIADLLEVLARVIRRSGCHGRNPPQDQPGGAA